VNTIRLSKSCIGEEEKSAVNNVLVEEHLGMGRHVQEFEKKLSNYFDGRNVVCVNSGTAALHLAIMASGIKPHDEILVQSLTYVASYQAIKGAGAIPVSCEVYKNNLTIDLDDAEKKITPKTKAIMPVHYSGGVGDLDAIYKFAERHQLRVIEDAAHAFGTKYKEKLVGSFGDTSCFSFDGIKNITSGEGGAIVTNDLALVEYAKDARLLGVEKDTEKRYKAGRSWDFNVHHQGYRYHMSNINAAIGIVQLGRVKEFASARCKLAKKYDEAFFNNQKLTTINHKYDDVVPHIYTIRLKSGNRDELKNELAKKNIESGVHYYPNHLLKYFGDSEETLKVTEDIYSKILTIPLHPDLTEENQSLVIETIDDYFKSL